MFRKPAKTKIGGKFLVYGFSGEGKSFFGLTFPKIGAIDSETGLAFYEDTDIEISGKTYNNLAFVDTTSDLDELEEDLDNIIDGDIDIDTLLIDSETKFYNTMDIGATEAEEKKAKLNGKAVDARSKWGRIKNINMKFQQAKITASAKGVHVVSTAQGLEITDDDTKKVIGYKPDAHKSLKFDYDVVLRFYVEEDKKTKERRYFAEVMKDRTNVTKVGQIIENCTYDVWKLYFDNRNGLGISGANFTKDLKNSTDSVLNNAELSTKLSKDIKAFISEHKTETDVLKHLKSIADNSNIDMKNLDLEEPKKLQEFINAIKKLK
ncbi:AAA family ATPase [Clostridium sp. VAP52]|uniref:AAA family ATPase n=1 Tax=Clostridium sp. VAP52 TaxID=2949977 RepID=UPI00207AD063|nr:AAA family ATPase [Clostridium sp. VAP52]